MTSPRLVPAALLAVGALVAAAPAGDAAPARSALTGAVTLGAVQPQPAPCNDGITVVQTVSPAGVSYVVPEAGVVTALRTQSPIAGAVRGLIVRAAPGGFAVVGKSATTPAAAGTPVSMPVRIPVQAGDLLGIQSKAEPFSCVADSTPDARVAYSAAAFDPDTQSVFVPSGTQAAIVANIAATLEPDADGDGFGDVSQDACPQSGTTQGACPADAALATKVAKRTTKRKVAIAFTTAVPGSTTTCKVDRSKAKPCTSPFQRRYRPGKHKVVITTTSPSGVVDTTPLTVRFRVLEKR